MLPHARTGATRLRYHFLPEIVVFALPKDIVIEVQNIVTSAMFDDDEKENRDDGGAVHCSSRIYFNRGAELHGLG